MYIRADESKRTKECMEKEPSLYVHPNLEWLAFVLEAKTDYLEYRLGGLGAEGELLLLDVHRVLGTNPS